MRGPGLQGGRAVRRGAPPQGRGRGPAAQPLARPAPAPRARDPPGAAWGRAPGDRPGGTQCCGSPRRPPRPEGPGRGTGRGRRPRAEPPPPERLGWPAGDGWRRGGNRRGSGPWRWPRWPRPLRGSAVALRPRRWTSRRRTTRPSPCSWTRRASRPCPPRGSGGPTASTSARSPPRPGWPSGRPPSGATPPRGWRRPPRCSGPCRCRAPRGGSWPCTRRTAPSP